MLKEYFSSSFFNVKVQILELRSEKTKTVFLKTPKFPKFLLTKSTWLVIFINISWKPMAIFNNPNAKKYFMLKSLEKT